MIRIYKYGEVPVDEILVRSGSAPSVEGAVREIIADVRARGDAALIDYAAKLNKARITSLEVSPDEFSAAFDKISSSDPGFIGILNRAAANIRAFHSCQLRNGFLLNRDGGIILGQKILPLQKVGVYVPGGAAPLSSTVLMDIIPAKIAGVKEIIMVSAPEADGSINPYILAAARIAGADRVFKCGGAQAVAALAYGTGSIPAVDKIVGPGSAYVAEAKKQVFGKVGIDMVAGPSEILAIADAGTDAVQMAADMLSQAEHDTDASAVLITDSEELALKVRDEIERQLRTLPREEIARASIENNGKIIVTGDIMTAVDIANKIAPEHLELMVDKPFDLLDKVVNAGSVFLGRHAPEALGDYFAGANHTLPTGGTARYASPLSVDDFVKKTQYIYYSEEALEAVAEDIAYFAEKEQLSGHARSVLSRRRSRDA